VSACNLFSLHSLAELRGKPSCFAASNFDQLVWRKEVQFDRSTFTWLGTPTQVEQIL
jgi:hypothetical protein